MPVCPTCGEKITYLNSSERCWVDYKARASKQYPDTIKYSKKHDIVDGECHQYECPKCHNEIDNVNDEESAYKFLKGLPYGEELNGH